MVGQSVPDCGRVGATGVDVDPGVAVGPEVAPQTQSASAVQDGFLQKPP